MIPRLTCNVTQKNEIELPKLVIVSALVK